MFDFKEMKVFFRGDYVPYSEAQLSIANTGFIYGLGIFTGMRAHYNEQQKKLFVFRIKEHFERFRNACKLCHYDNFLASYDEKKFGEMILGLLRENNLAEDAYIRITNFSDEETITPKFLYKDSLCAYLYPLGNYISTSGVKCMVSSWVRVEDNALPARAKFTGAYINTAFAKTDAIKHGYDDAIFLDSRGHVVEGSAANLFLVMNGQLITPPVTDNILEGITRGSVMEIARDEGIPVIERTIDRTELYKADEAFLCGTGVQVAPVTQIDTYAVGNGAVGPVAKKLQALYFDVVRGRVDKYQRWLTQV